MPFSGYKHPIVLVTLIGYAKMATQSQRRHDANAMAFADVQAITSAASDSHALVKTLRAAEREQQAVLDRINAAMQEDDDKSLRNEFITKHLYAEMFDRYARQARALALQYSAVGERIDKYLLTNIMEVPAGAIESQAAFYIIGCYTEDLPLEEITSAIKDRCKRSFKRYREARAAVELHIEKNHAHGTDELGFRSLLLDLRIADLEQTNLNSMFARIPHEWPAKQTDWPLVLTPKSYDEAN